MFECNWNAECPFRTQFSPLLNICGQLRRDKMLLQKRGVTNAVKQKQPCSRQVDSVTQASSGQVISNTGLSLPCGWIQDCLNPHSSLVLSCLLRWDVRNFLAALEILSRRLAMQWWMDWRARPRRSHFSLSSTREMVACQEDRPH